MKTEEIPMKKYLFVALFAAICLVPSINFAEEEGEVVAVMYEHHGFKGRSLKFHGGHLNLRGWWNDKVSSISVSPGKSIVIYEHYNFKGKARVIRGNVNLRGWWNDQASSIR
jgi:hypothetical protein